MTDMQGQDYRALRSAGSALRRVHYLITETWLHNVSSYKVGMPKSRWLNGL